MLRNNRATLAVLMSSYNSAATLPSAVQSVLASVQALHLYIVDDGSKIPVSRILGKTPANVTILRLPKNVGLTRALNNGLDEIFKHSHIFIARMDADDIAHPQRFYRQLQFLQKHPHIALVGSWANFVNEQTLQPLFTYTPPTNMHAIRNKLFFNTCILHPTWLARAEAIQKAGGYNSAYPAVEDYEMLRRLAKTRHFANLPEALLQYRVSTQGISLKKRNQQLRQRLRVQWHYRQPLNWRTWAGIMQTLALFLLPAKLLQSIKKRRHFHA